MNIYIIHYKKLKERKNYLDNMLSTYYNEPIYIDDYDRDTLIIDDIKYNPNLWDIRTDGLYNGKIVYRDLKKSEIKLDNIKVL